MKSALAPLLGILGLLLVAIVGSTVLGGDHAVSDLFYDPVSDEPWPQGNTWWCQLLDAVGPLPTFVLFVGCLIAWALRRRNRMTFFWVAIFLLLVPGGVVHGLKNVWGRPRPRDVLHWQRPEPYSEWWQPAGPGQGAGFPSGHSGSAAALVSLTILFLAHRRWVCLGAGLVIGAFGGMVSLSRIADGAHYLTDVLWAWSIVFTGAVGLVIVLSRRAPH